MFNVLVVSNNPAYTNELKRAALLADTEIVAICFSIEDVRNRLLNGLRPDAIIASDVLYPGSTPEGLVQELTMAGMLNKTCFVLRNPDVSDFLMNKNVQYVFESTTSPEQLLNMLTHNSGHQGGGGYNPYQSNPYQQQPQGNPYGGPAQPMSPQNNMNQQTPYGGYQSQMQRQNESFVQQDMTQRLAQSQRNSYGDEMARQQSYGPKVVPNNTNNFKSIMIAIHSPKGGVGKTSLAIELSFLLASRAKEVDLNPTSKLSYTKNVTVCLVDFNPCFDTMAATLDCVRTTPNYPTVSDWIQKIEEKIFESLSPEDQQRLMKDDRHDFSPYIDEDRIRFTREEVESLLVKDPETGLFLLPSIALPFDVEYAKPQYLRIILRTIRAMFDVVIVDTGNNISFFTVQPLKEANEIFLVTSPTAGASVVLGKLTKNLERMDLDVSKFSLVVNNPNGVSSELEPETIAQVLKLPLISVLPFDEKIMEAHEKGKPYCIYNKKAPFTRETVKLAQQICPLWDTVKRGGRGKSKPSRQEGGRKKSLFGR